MAPTSKKGQESKEGVPDRNEQSPPENETTSKNKRPRESSSTSKRQTSRSVSQPESVPITSPLSSTTTITNDVFTTTTSTSTSSSRKSHRSTSSKSHKSDHNNNNNNNNNNVSPIASPFITQDTNANMTIDNSATLLPQTYQFLGSTSTVQAMVQPHPPHIQTVSPSLQTTITDQQPQQYISPQVYSKVTPSILRNATPLAPHGQTSHPTINPPQTITTIITPGTHQNPLPILSKLVTVQNVHKPLPNITIINPQNVQTSPTNIHQNTNIVYKETPSFSNNNNNNYHVLTTTKTVDNVSHTSNNNINNGNTNNNNNNNFHTTNNNLITSTHPPLSFPSNNNNNNNTINNNNIQNTTPPILEKSSTPKIVPNDTQPPP